MRGRIGRVLLVLGIVAAFVLVPAAALAQDDNDDEGFLLRINGSAVVAADETADAAIVVRGDLLVEGTARTVIVVDGNATLRGADVDTLIVVRGTADLQEGTVVSGDAFLTDATLASDATSEVAGTIRENFEGFLIGFWILGILLAIGLAIMAILGALTFAGVAPDTARRAGHAIRHDLGRVALAGVGFWIVLPIAAGLLLVTIVGIPTALAIWLAVMPIMGFIGYLATGIWIGELIVARHGGEGHPYLAAFVGTLLLVIVGFVPAVGPVIGTVAALLGASALALVAWRNVFQRSSEDTEPAPG